MNINFSERELEVIKELSEQKDIPPEKVIIQALRLYQAVSLGVVEIVQKPGLCKAEESP